MEEYLLELLNRTLLKKHTPIIWCLMISHMSLQVFKVHLLTTGFGDSKTNAIGFATNNGCVLVNDAFQQPSSLEQGNYDFNQVATATTITFTGEADLLQHIVDQLMSIR